MIPILYNDIVEGTVSVHYGLGALVDCLSCEVTEERNGAYELTLTYAASGIHAEDIQVNRFIKVKPNFTDDPQLFRIYKIGKTMNGRFSVSAQHVSYDLSGKLIKSGSAGSCLAACALLEDEAGDFTISTDKNLAATFAITEPSSVRSWFGGKEGSILDVYGPGEWKYDNYDISFLSSRGQDRGVVIRYGKNLTELNQDLSMENLVTSVLPYYIDQDGNKTIGTAVPTGLVLDVERDLAVDFSDRIDPESQTPIATQLQNLATSYVNNNNLTSPLNNITLNFVQLGELAERVDLCDTVHIYYEALGISATAKCIAVTWDALAERYVSTTFGDAKTNITDTIITVSKESKNAVTRSVMAEAIANATAMITGNLGGYVILHDTNNDGEPDEILIMNTADINTATKVWRWNKNGLGYSSNGYAGTYGLAMTADGAIVADFITTGTLTANIIKAGILEDIAHNSYFNLTTGAALMTSLKAKNNFTLVDSNDVDRATISYTVGGGTAIRTLHSNGQATTSIETNPSTGNGSVSIGDPSGNLLGTMQIGTYGGRLALGSPNDSKQVFLAVDVNGGLCKIQDGSGVERVLLTTTALSGKLVFKNPSDAVITELTNTNNGGGMLLINNNTGQNLITISSTDNGGYFYLGNHSGTVNATIQTTAAGDGTVNVCDNGGSVTINLSGQSGIVTCVSVQQTSSRKVKKNIKPIKDARKILDLEAVSFDYKNKSLGTDRRGFIAEDVAEILPNLVTPETEERTASLDYVGMIPYLQAVIKEQDKRIEALENKIKALEDLINGTN